MHSRRGPVHRLTARHPLRLRRASLVEGAAHRIGGDQGHPRREPFLFTASRLQAPAGPEWGTTATLLRLSDEMACELSDDGAILGGTCGHRRRHQVAAVATGPRRIILQNDDGWPIGLLS